MRCIFFPKTRVYLTKIAPERRHTDAQFLYTFPTADQIKKLFYTPEYARYYFVSRQLYALEQAFRRPFYFLRAAGCVARNKRGEFLVIKRRGLYDLPKGKAEVGESLRQTAVREVAEETGVKVCIVSALATSSYVYAEKTQLFLKKVLWYLADVAEPAVLRAQREEGISEVFFADAAFMKQTFMRRTFPSLPNILKPILSPKKA